MMGVGTRAKCKNCGQEALADQFKLHYQLKLMVCPNCFTGKKSVKTEMEKVAAGPPKPKGWDKEDEYLEKASRLRKEEVTANFTKMPGSDQVQCKCLNCKYSFKFDPYRQTPKTCPYCDQEVPKLKSFGF